MTVCPELWDADEGEARREVNLKAFCLVLESDIAANASTPLYHSVMSRQDTQCLSKLYPNHLSYAERTLNLAGERLALVFFLSTSYESDHLRYDSTSIPSVYAISRGAAGLVDGTR